MRRLVLLSWILVACTTSEARTPPAPAKTAAGASPVAPGTVRSSPPAAADAEAPSAPPPPVTAIYPWRSTAAAADRLDVRFRDAPPGFTRVDVAPGSFGEFLRTLPLQPEGAPVVDFRGNRLYDEGRHSNIVAVADLDIGSKDLQQCADSILRLHAEWRYGRGDRDLAYRAASGQLLSYRGYVAGDRAVLDGKNLVLRRSAVAKKDDHALFRAWLDEVFAWAGTASLERDAKKVGSVAEARGGDFFVLSGSPFGHAVLVLDVARDASGRTALLLGQSYMPAQSFQVLRPSAGGSAWFIVDARDAVVETPFWRPFPIAALRRLD